MSGDYKKFVSLESVKQTSAEMYWQWIDGRISAETHSQCDVSIKSIHSLLTNIDRSDARFRVVVTQSVSTLAELSPFGRLESYLTRHALRCVHLKGSEYPTLSTLQTALLAAALGVNGNAVSSDANLPPVSLIGLDLTILDHHLLSLLPPEQEIVVILEDSGSVDREVLFDMVCLMYHVSKKVLPCLSLIIDSELGDSLLEEVVSDESIFLDLNIVHIPLISARQLESGIKRIFSSDSTIRGFPVDISQADICVLSKCSVSLVDLTASLFLLVSDWFRTCPYSFLAGYEDDEVFEKLVEKCEKKNTKIFIQNFVKLQTRKQTLAVLNRVLKSIFVKSLSTELVIQIDALTALNGSGAIEKFLLLARHLVPGRAVILETLETVDELISWLISVMEFSPSSDVIVALREDLSRPLKNLTAGYNQTQLGEDFFQIIRNYCQTQLQPVSPELLRIAALFRGKESNTRDVVRSLVAPETFSGFVEFLRMKKRETKGKLSDLHALSQIVWAPKTLSTVEFDLLTKQAKGLTGDSLATSLATLEFLGLVKRPAAVDIFTGIAQGNSVKLRKSFRSLLGDNEEEEEENGEEITRWAVGGG